MLYAVGDNGLVEWNAVQQFCFTASVLWHLFVTIRDELAHPPKLERRTTSRAKSVELSGKKTTVRAQVSSKVEIWLEDGESLSRRRRAPRFET